MNLKYIDLYFEILGNNAKKTLCKEYFYYMKSEIEYYKSLNMSDRQKYYKSIKNNKKQIEEIGMSFDYSYIPTAYNIYQDSCNVYNFIEEMDKCNKKDVDKTIDKFIRLPLSLANKKEEIIIYSLIKKFKSDYEKEINKLTDENKYLMGYLKHFRNYFNIEYSLDSSIYYDKYSTKIFKEIIESLKNDDLYEIIKDKPYLTKHIINFCFNYMNSNNYLRTMYADLKKAILAIYDKVLKNKTTLLNDNIKSSIDLTYIYMRDNELILKLLTGEYKSIKDFCESENITPSLFNRFITYLKNSKPELYDNYALIRDNMVKNRYVSLVEYSKNILNLINNGIMINENEVREFDNLDYLLMCNMDITVFKRIVESSPELKNIKNNGTNGCGNYNGFCRKYLNRNKIMINLDRLKNQKKVIANHEVTDIEKENVVNFFINNGLPLEEGLITIALRRQVSGEIDFTNYKVTDIFNELLVDDEYIDVYVDGTEKKYIKNK